MLFDEGLQWLRKGDKVRRKGWDKGKYLTMRFVGGEHILALECGDGIWKPYTLACDEYFAHDWEKVEIVIIPDLGVEYLENVLNPFCTTEWKNIEIYVTQNTLNFVFTKDGDNSIFYAQLPLPTSQEYGFQNLEPSKLYSTEELQLWAKEKEK